MSRIGKRELVIPEGVTVTIENNKVTCKGPKGELNYTYCNLVNVTQDNGKIIVTRINDTARSTAMHGTTNSLINGMLIGVKNGFEVELEAVGVGYKFNPKGKVLTVHAGYSHPVDIKVPDGLEVEGKSNTEIIIKGIDKQRVSEFAANVRKIRKPEPYKGKGIRYKGEHIRRKEGKKAA